MATDTHLAGQTLEELIRDAAGRLVQVSDSPRIDAKALAQRAFGLDAAGLIRDGNTTPAAEGRLAFQNSVSRRLAGEPVAYITGLREFWSLALEVDDAVLIPRPDTEQLVEVALGFLSTLKDSCRVLDAGTGSGAIALAIASEYADASVLAIDADDAAISVAARNARRLALSNVRFVVSNWYEQLDPEHRFDLIVSNPPYIADDDPHLERGDVAFEPRQALVSGADGLADLKTIISGSTAFLVDGAMLVVEHGAAQGEAVRNIFHGAGFSQVSTHTDLAGLERVTSGHKRADV